MHCRCGLFTIMLYCVQFRFELSSKLLLYLTYTIVLCCYWYFVCILTNGCDQNFHYFIFFNIRHVRNVNFQRHTQGTSVLLIHTWLSNTWICSEHAECYTMKGFNKSEFNKNLQVFPEVRIFVSGLKIPGSTTDRVPWLLAQWGISIWQSWISWSWIW